MENSEKTPKKWDVNKKKDTNFDVLPGKIIMGQYEDIASAVAERAENEELESYYSGFKWDSQKMRLLTIFSEFFMNIVRQQKYSLKIEQIVGSISQIPGLESHEIKLILEMVASFNFMPFSSLETRFTQLHKIQAGSKDHPSYNIKVLEDQVEGFYEAADKICQDETYVNEFYVGRNDRVKQLAEDIVKKAFKAYDKGVPPKHQGSTFMERLTWKTSELPLVVFEEKSDVEQHYGFQGIFIIPRYSSAEDNYMRYTFVALGLEFLGTAYSVCGTQLYQCNFYRDPSFQNFDDDSETEKEEEEVKNDAKAAKDKSKFRLIRCDFMQYNLPARILYRNSAAYHALLFPRELSYELNKLIKAEFKKAHIFSMIFEQKIMNSDCLLFVDLNTMNGYFGDEFNPSILDLLIIQNAKDFYKVQTEAKPLDVMEIIQEVQQRRGEGSDLSALQAKIFKGMEMRKALGGDILGALNKQSLERKREKKREEKENIALRAQEAKQAIAAAAAPVVEEKIKVAVTDKESLFYNREATLGDFEEMRESIIADCQLPQIQSKHLISFDEIDVLNAANLKTMVTVLNKIELKSTKARERQAFLGYLKYVQQQYAVVAEEEKKAGGGSSKKKV